MIIKTWRDPYDAGFTPTRPKEIELLPGLTVLVGCNGAGKSTLLHNIKDVCAKQNIPCLYYDNLTDGGHNAFSSLMYEGNYEEGASLFLSSEGECIKSNLGRKAKLFSEFIDKGIVNDKSYQFMKLFIDNEPEITTKDRMFLFDAVDSGLSVDSIVEVKSLFQMVLDDCKDKDRNIYIIIAANEYELARNTDCFDVNKGEYIRFKDYEDYRSFIIKSRKKKEQRIDNQIKWQEKQRQKEFKEYRRIKSLQEEKLEELRIRKERGETVSSWEQRDVEHMITDFLRNKTRFLKHEDIDNLQAEGEGE